MRWLYFSNLWKFMQHFTDQRSELTVNDTHLQNDIDPGQTAPSAEADLHVVQATVALGDVPDLSVTTALGNRILWRRESDVHRRK